MTVAERPPYTHKETLWARFTEEEKKIRDTLYNIKETVVTSGQGEQASIVPN